MIRYEGVHYRYPVGDWILKGLDLEVLEGESVLLCGASGSGKSTAGYLANGLIPHFFGGTLQGRICVDGTDTRESRAAQLFSRVGLVLQNADAQFFNGRVDDELAFGLENLGLPPADIETRIRQTAAELELESLLDRSPETLSGGEKRLVALASMLVLKPGLLFLDEPFAHLDWNGATRIATALRKIRGQGTAVIIAEQQLEDFLSEAGRCLVLEGGVLTFDGSPESAAGRLAELDLIPCYPERPRRGGSSGGTPLVAVENLTAHLGGHRVLDAVSLSLQPGETVALIGRNGSGKTTLIKHLNGLLRPTEGRVIFNGRDIARETPARLASRVGVSFQNPNDQFFKTSVREELHAGPLALMKRNAKMFDREGIDRWMETLVELFELGAFLDRPPARLSEGQKKRLALASILAVRPRLLVLDEPTVGQDGRFRKAMARLLGQLETFGLTTLVVTHDLDFARAVADRWIVLHEGRVLADGNPASVLKDPRLAETGALGSRRLRAWEDPCGPSLAGYLRKGDSLAAL